MPRIPPTRNQSDVRTDRTPPPPPEAPRPAALRATDGQPRVGITDMRRTDITQRADTAIARDIVAGPQPVERPLPGSQEGHDQAQAARAEAQRRAIANGGDFRAPVGGSGDPVRWVHVNAQGETRLLRPDQITHQQYREAGYERFHVQIEVVANGNQGLDGLRWRVELRDQNGAPSIDVSRPTPRGDAGGIVDREIWVRYGSEGRISVRGFRPGDDRHAVVSGTGPYNSNGEPSLAFRATQRGGQGTRDASSASAESTAASDSVATSDARQHFRSDTGAAEHDSSNEINAYMGGQSQGEAAASGRFRPLGRVGSAILGTGVDAAGRAAGQLGANLRGRHAVSEHTRGTARQDDGSQQQRATTSSTERQSIRAAYAASRDVPIESRVLDITPLPSRVRSVHAQDY